MEVNWERQRPSKDEIKELNKLDWFIEDNFMTDEIQKVVTILNENSINGGAKFISIRLIENEILDWFLSRNNFKSLNFFTKMFQSKAYNKIEKELTPQKGQNEDFINYHSNKFTLDGEIAGVLTWGGAYKNVEDYSFAKKLGLDFCRSLFQERYKDIEVFYPKDYNYEWSEWFYKFGIWNFCSIIFDSKYRRISILAVTDID